MIKPPPNEDDIDWWSKYYATIGREDACGNFLECGYWGHQPRLLTPHNGTIWSLSVSDWLNTLVSADSSGEVVGAVLAQMMTHLTNHKPFTKRRFCVFRVELEAIEDGDAEVRTKRRRRLVIAQCTMSIF